MLGASGEVGRAGHARAWAGGRRGVALLDERCSGDGGEQGQRWSGGRVMAHRGANAVRVCVRARRRCRVERRARARSGGLRDEAESGRRRCTPACRGGQHGRAEQEAAGVVRAGRRGGAPSGAARAKRGRGPGRARAEEKGRREEERKEIWEKEKGKRRGEREKEREREGFLPALIAASTAAVGHARVVGRHAARRSERKKEMGHRLFGTGKFFRNLGFGALGGSRAQ